MRSRAEGFAAAAALGAVLLAASPAAPAPARSRSPAAAPRSDAAILGRSDQIVVARAATGDTAASLAKRLLNDASQGWRVATLDGGPIRPGAVVAVSLDARDPGFAQPARFVPVLCYHRFAEGRSSGQMEVAADAFEAQLRWLRDDGYTIVPLSQVAEFAEGRRLLPPKAVAISIDDGYRSAVRVALPILRRYNAPATLFVYSDFVGAGEAVEWADLADLQNDPLIDVQSHSKTHGDMVRKAPGETRTGYLGRVREEVSAPLAAFGRRFHASPRVFAYPYGSADPTVAGEVRRGGYEAAVTVARGGNAPWSPPLFLRRDMIYGGDSLAEFQRRVHAAERGGVEGPRETER